MLYLVYLSNGDFPYLKDNNRGYQMKNWILSIPFLLCWDFTMAMGLKVEDISAHKNAHYQRIGWRHETL